MSYETIHLDKICRTCLSEGTNTRSVFSFDPLAGETARLSEMLMYCTSVQVVDNDGLPSQICLQCVQYISKSFAFKQLCERSENTLRELLGRPKQSCLELKPLLSNSGLVSNISSVDDPLSAPVTADTLTTVKVTSDYPILPMVPGSDFKIKVSQEDLDIKFESFENELAFPNETGQDQKGELIVKSLEEIKDETNDTIVDETEQPIYPCEDCTFCFTTPSDLRVHSKTHYMKIRHTCKICRQCFSSVGTLRRHMMVHGAPKQYLCSECGKGFSRSDDLTRHLRVHTGEKPFPCTTCGKSFAQSFRLLEHMRAHADKKTFVCTVCGKGFSRSSGLSTHNKVHSGVKSHQCSVCGKKLSGSGSLAMHMKIHTGVKDHVCSYCGKGFTTPSNLIIHKRIHTRERPYVCTQCGKAFPDQSRLKAHVNSHSKEKPYVCKTCGRGCVTSSHLKKHMRIHTRKKPIKGDL